MKSQTINNHQSFFDYGTDAMLRVFNFLQRNKLIEGRREASRLYILLNMKCISINTYAKAASIFPFYQKPMWAITIFHATVPPTEKLTYKLPEELHPTISCGTIPLPRSHKQLPGVNFIFYLIRSKHQQSRRDEMIVKKSNPLKRP